MESKLVSFSVLCSAKEREEKWDLRDMPLAAETLTKVAATGNYDINRMHTLRTNMSKRHRSLVETSLNRNMNRQYWEQMFQNIGSWQNEKVLTQNDATALLQGVKAQLDAWARSS